MRFQRTFFAISAPLMAGAALAQSLWIEVESLDPGADRAAFEAAGFDVAGSREGGVGLIVDAAELDCLRAEGRSAELLGVGGAFRDRAVPGDAMAIDDGYRTWAEVQADLVALEAARPDLARVVDLMDDLSIPPTAEGRHLLALKISDRVDEEEDEPALLFIALHHARELNTIEAAFDTAEELLARYDGDRQVRDWVDDYQIWIVPVVNPDGLEHVWQVNAYWRKNRRDNGGGVYGVDLNRNYPFLWGACGNVSAMPESDVYRGPSPGSEPEVQAMMALAERERPVVVISYHSYGREVLYPYRCATLAESKKVWAGRNFYAGVADYDWRLASASGEDFEWHYNSHNSMAYLIEIGAGFQPPYHETLSEIEEHVRPAWRAVLERIGRAPGVLGPVRDGGDDTPLGAEIEIAEIGFVEGERIGADSRHGSYHVVLPPGTYTLTFTAPDHLPATHSVAVSSGWSQLDVWLDRQ